eukprot:scaffold4787_cov117-Isochrysis_galbana.AAC.2
MPPPMHASTPRCSPPPSTPPPHPLQEPPLDPPVQLSITTECCDGPGEATPAGDSITRLGEPFIEERLLGLRFRVSGSSFFQVNTGAAEGLRHLPALRTRTPARTQGARQRHVGRGDLPAVPGDDTSCEYTGAPSKGAARALLGGRFDRNGCTQAVGPDTVVLDVCCGTGTIGLCMASVAKRVIGIEMNTKAVQDARSNALLNSIPNAEFIASTAEAATRRVLSRLSAAERESLVAVVDPPRAGLHNDVIKALRGCLPLKRILFVSCHAPAFVRNAVGFCRPPSRAFEGEPFTPTRAFAVDLFPDTEHCELVVLLERQGSAQSKPDETTECQASAQSEPTDAPGGEPPAPELMPGVDGQQPVTEEGESSAEVGRVSAEGDAEPARVHPGRLTSGRFRAVVGAYGEGKGSGENAHARAGVVLLLGGGSLLHVARCCACACVRSLAGYTSYDLDLRRFAGGRWRWVVRSA